MFFQLCQVNYACTIVYGNLFTSTDCKQMQIWIVGNFYHLFYYYWLWLVFAKLTLMSVLVAAAKNIFKRFDLRTCILFSIQVMWFTLLCLFQLHIHKVPCIVMWTWLSQFLNFCCTIRLFSFLCLIIICFQ